MTHTFKYFCKDVNIIHNIRQTLSDVVKQNHQILKKHQLNKMEKEKKNLCRKTTDHAVIVNEVCSRLHFKHLYVS